MFESSVNSEGIETKECVVELTLTFESSVNSEGIETCRRSHEQRLGLRAV